MEDLDKPKASKIPSVDYQKTIASGRMTYHPKRDFGDIAFKVLALIGIFAIPYVAVQMVVNGEAYAPIYLVLSCLFSLWLILGLFLSGKLVKVKGTGLPENKEDAIKTVNEFYPHRSFNESTDNILRDYEPGSMTGGRIITVLFNGNDVYFHKIKLGKGEGLFTFWGPTDHRIAQHMAYHFEYLQSKRAVSAEKQPA